MQELRTEASVETFRLLCPCRCREGQKDWAVRGGRERSRALVTDVRERWSSLYDPRDLGSVAPVIRLIESAVETREMHVFGLRVILGHLPTLARVR